ncbi:MAG: GNAT family N-acetyltransferase [Clostridiaceae bacterium]|nr:GNAT family N-acetyltransferase [Clostridiaceae bacterium]
MIEIVEVKTRKQLRDFILFPFKIYKDNPYWVPPLIMDEFNTLDKRKNPAFEYCDAKYWLAYKDGKLVGRIAGIQNHAYVKKWGNKYTRFGWVDFIDDPEVSKALFNTVEEYARENGMGAVHGPLGFCDLDSQGLLVDGFEEMGTIITYYHYPYYKKHMEQLGYEKDVDWLEYEILVPEKNEIERLNKIADRSLEKYGLRMVELENKKQILPYANQVFEIINIAYEEIYGVVPLTEKQIKGYVDQYFSYVNPDYICLIVDKDEKLAGFGISVPSLSNAVKKHNGRIFPFGFIDILKDIKHNDTLDLYLVAVKPEYKLTGIPAAMLNHSLRNAHKNGIKKAIASPQLENNYAVQSLWRFFDARPHRRRRCFIKRLNENS